MLNYIQPAGIHLIDARQVNDIIDQVNGNTTAITALQSQPATAQIGPQIVTTRCALFNTLRQGTAGARTDVRIENRRKVYVGPQAIQQLFVVNPGNFYVNSSSGETVLGNDYTYEVAIENITPSCYQEAYFGGTNLPTIVQGCQSYTSGAPVNYDFPAGGSFWIRQAFSVADNTKFIPSCSQSLATGDTGFISPSVTSQVPGTGAMTTPSGGTSFGGPNPPFIVGYPVAPHPSVVFVGDSIADGTGDTIDTLGNLGFIARGLESVNGFPIPNGRESVGSWTLAKCTLDTAPRLRSFWQYATHLIIQLGTNDISGNNTSLSAMQTYVTNLITAAHRVTGPYGKPLKVAVCTLFPRTTSTDSWATAANQTPVAHMGVGETRDTYNAWVLTKCGGLADYYIDVNQHVADPSRPSVWLTNGSANTPTADGIHPSSAYHILAAQAVNGWGAGITYNS